METRTFNLLKNRLENLSYHSNQTITFEFDENGTRRNANIDVSGERADYVRIRNFIDRWNPLMGVEITMLGDNITNCVFVFE